MDSYKRTKNHPHQKTPKNKNRNPPQKPPPKKKTQKKTQHNNPENPTTPPPKQKTPPQKNPNNPQPCQLKQLKAAKIRILLSWKQTEKSANDKRLELKKKKSVMAGRK